MRTSWVTNCAAWDRVPGVAPEVTAITPTVGDTAGGTSVTITGTGLNAVTAVTFGGTPAASFTIDSDSQITAVSPAHAYGGVDVVVTESGVGSDTVAAGFWYTSSTFADDFNGGLDPAWVGGLAGSSNQATATNTGSSIKILPSATGYYADCDFVSSGVGRQPEIDIFIGEVLIGVDVGSAYFNGNSIPTARGNATASTGSGGAPPIRCRIEVLPESGKMRVRLLTGAIGAGTPSTLRASVLSAGAVTWHMDRAIAIKLGEAFGGACVFDNFEAGPL